MVEAGRSEGLGAGLRPGGIGGQGTFDALLMLVTTMASGEVGSAPMSGTAVHAANRPSHSWSPLAEHCRPDAKTTGPPHI